MRLRITKMVLWFLVGVAVVVAIARLFIGLGATTNLTDNNPWGLWIGFDVFSGVALAAGGFVIAGTVYVFHLEKYRPIVRAAVLTAFLGYTAVVVGLIFDIGKPWNIWRPVFFWQPHSALFEVAWCVILYLTVLALEFSQVVLEKTRFKRITQIAKKATVPLVILGIMLSTLHQSSLGTLMVLAPYRLHQLWYTPILPLLFFVSAISLGLAMVMSESKVSAWLYEKESHNSLCEGLAKAASVVLAIYLCLRIGDLAVRGSLGYLLEGSSWSWLFIAEISISTIIPLVIFALPQTRRIPGWLTAGAFMAVIGFVLNRINVSGLATMSETGAHYLPSWTELSVSLGVVSGAGLVFLMFVERFNVYEEPRALVIPAVPPADPLTGVRLSTPWAGDGRRYSLAFVIGAALAFGLLPDSAIHHDNVRPTPVREARVAEAVRINGGENRPDTLSLAIDDIDDEALVEAMIIDGNRDGRYVLFDHQGHQQRYGGRESCGQCHHANEPMSNASSCTLCHSDMYEPNDVFDHGHHVASLGNNRSCSGCHQDSSLARTRENTASCLACHQTMLVEGSRVLVDEANFAGMAAGYMDAMHGLCVDCHQQEQEQSQAHLAPHLGRCATCHNGSEGMLRSLEPHLPSEVATTEGEASRLGDL